MATVYTGAAVNVYSLLSLKARLKLHQKGLKQAGLLQAAKKMFNLPKGASVSLILDHVEKAILSAAADIKPGDIREV